MKSIATSASVAVDVVLGDDSTVGHFCVLGLDGKGDALSIGDRATIRSHTVIYRGTRAGTDFHVGHGALVRDSTEIGNAVSIGSHSVVEHHVVLRDRVRLHTNCFVPEESIIDEGAWLGPGVIVTNARHPNRPDTKSKLEGVHVGAHAVIGAGVVILPGVRIGAMALVGAGAVVTHDVAEGDVVVGNPASMLR